MRLDYEIFDAVCFCCCHATKFIWLFNVVERWKLQTQITGKIVCVWITAYGFGFGFGPFILFVIGIIWNFSVSNNDFIHTTGTISKFSPGILCCVNRFFFCLFHTRNQLHLLEKFSKFKSNSYQKRRPYQIPVNVSSWYYQRSVYFRCMDFPEESKTQACIVHSDRQQSCCALVYSFNTCYACKQAS